MEFIKNLDLNTQQLQAFNYGFVCLAESDSIVLMDITESEFNNKYKHYYNIGNSYYRYECLKRIMEKANNQLNTLKEYGAYRNVFTNNTEPSFNTVNTAELIKKMKGE